MKDSILEIILYGNRNNVHYVIDNKEYSAVDPGTLLKLLEDDNYMLDYFPDETCDEVEIRFDNIKNYLK